MRSSISFNASLSQHPTDQLIRELIRTGRAATEDEIEQIVERMATAPFNPQIVRVPGSLQGILHRGQRLGSRASSLAVHLLQGIVLNEQWAGGTSERQYLHDLRRAVRAPTAHLAIYERRGGPIAGVFAPNVVPSPR